MLSLYESILGGMDDIIDSGDNIVDNIAINDDNSILNKIFPGVLENRTFEIGGSNDYKILSVKGRGEYAYCDAGNISEIITNVKELKIYNSIFIVAEDGLDGNSIKDSLCETIVAPSISVDNAININGVNFIAKKNINSNIPLIIFSNKTKKLTNCSLESETLKNFTSRVLFTSIPEFKNVVSDSIEEIHIRYSASNFVYNVKDFITDTLNNSKLTDLFEYGYELNYKNGVGDNKKVKVNSLETLRKLTIAKDTSNRVYSEWPVRLKSNAKLSDLIDVSGFKNLSTIIIADDKFYICFENIKHSKNQKFGNSWINTYGMLKDKPVIISRSNEKEMEKTINKIPVTKDGWRVILYKL
jgi:hypothetical protein